VKIQFHLKMIGHLLVISSLSCAIAFGVGENCAHFNVLIEDMQKYKHVSRSNPPMFYHAGDLYEHSLWVEQVVAEWAEQDHLEHFWCEGLNSRDTYLMALAAFLHDVGKAGNCCYEGYECKVTEDKKAIVEYVGNPEHPRIGFEYLWYGDDQQRTLTKKKLSQSAYKLLDNQLSFDFNKLFDELEITHKERKLIAILVGIHWDFGTFVVTQWANTDHQLLAQRFLENLNALVQETKYNQGIIDESLLCMAMLIGAADVKGARPTAGTKTHLFKETIRKDAMHEAFIDGYEKFGFQAYGREVRDYLVEYFKNSWGK
jgi:hypothetical protein